MSRQVLLDKPTQEVLSCAYMDFTQWSGWDADKYQIVESYFDFNPSIASTKWKYDSGTFITIGVKEETVEILLQKGKDLRQKWLGYQFTAVAGQTTNHDIVMPFDGHIQGGHFHAITSKTGDTLSFIIMPGISGYEYAYIDAVPIAANETFKPMEEFGMTSLIPINTPMRIAYNNTDTTDKVIVLKMLYRIAE